MVFFPNTLTEQSMAFFKIRTDIDLARNFFGKFFSTYIKFLKKFIFGILKSKKFDEVFSKIYPFILLSGFSENSEATEHRSGIRVTCYQTFHNQNYLGFF